MSGGQLGARPTVTVAVPVLDEEATLPRLLRSIAEQTYPGIVEVLVVDGGSTDRSVQLASEHPGVRVLHNPRRIQSAALNLAIAEAKGDVMVRVDGHALLAEDHVEACMQALEATGAAMVGGAQRPVGAGWVQRGVAAAMRSRLGVGAAGYHREDLSGWVDTVWMGAYRTSVAESVGGYDESLPVNEDAEFARRMAAAGGVWLDSSIVARYVPRADLRGVVRQWGRYGFWRARTVRRDPASLQPRQLAAPVLVLGLVSPLRRWVAPAYALVVLGAAAGEWRRDRVGATAALLVIPAAQLSWGLGALLGALVPAGRRRR